MAYYEWQDNRFPEYVPVAERKARAARELAKLGKKRGFVPAPVKIEGREIARTFWGKAWCTNVEAYQDYENRLPRGRTYVRNGSVVHLEITEGRVHARVAGSELYQITMTIAPLAAGRWRAIKRACTGKIASLIGLLRGQLSDEVLGTLAHPETGLFPEPGEIEMTCSCPDSASLCKHLAATLYGVGARLDVEPALFFRLRKVDQAELISAATDGSLASVGKPGRKAGANGARQIAENRLSDVFGIELDETPADEPKKPKARAAKAKATATTARIKSSPAKPKGASTAAGSKVKPVVPAGKPTRTRRST